MIGFFLSLLKQLQLPTVEYLRSIVDRLNKNLTPAYIKLQMLRLLIEDHCLVRNVKAQLFMPTNVYMLLVVLEKDKNVLKRISNTI
jgi:nicotinic acid mononucleotide adenylyltransferase